MSDQVGFRIKESDNISKKQLDKKAEELGVSRTELIVKALEIVVDLDSEFIDKIEQIADKVNLEFGEVVQGFAVRRLAEIDANAEVWGSPTNLKELMRTDQGSPGAEYLYNSLREQMVKKQREEKLRGLWKKSQDGAELTEEEKEFVSKHGYGTVKSGNKTGKGIEFSWLEED